MFAADCVRGLLLAGLAALSVAGVLTLAELIGPGAKASVPVLVQKLRSEKDDGVRVNTAVALGSIRANPL